MQADSDVSLRQSVVDFARDSIAFAEDGVELSLCAKQPQFQRQQDQSAECQRHQQIEPYRLVEVRPQLELESRALFVPDAVVVGGLHAKRVAAGRNVRVVGSAARAGFPPVVVEAFEYVALADLLRRNEAQARVFELEVVVTSRDLEACCI